MKMHDIITILGKAIVAIFLSLLLNYIYIARISRLRRPSDKEFLDYSQITWQDKKRKYSPVDSQLSPETLAFLEKYRTQQEKTIKKKPKKTYGTRKTSRAERKRLNAKSQKQQKQ